MSFAAFSPTVFWLALFGSALALYALHRLKSRPKTVRVPTLQFWQSVAKPSRARRFFGPFRHPRTYAFSLLFLASLLLALADPFFEGEEKPVLLVCDWTPSLGANSGESTRLLAMADYLLARLDAEGPNARVAIAGLSASGLSYWGTAETPRPTLRKTLLELQQRVARASLGPAPLALAEAAASGEAQSSSALDFAAQPTLSGAEVRAMAGLLRARAKDSGAVLELLTDRPSAWQPHLSEARILTLGGVVSDLAWRGARQVGEALEVLFEREGDLRATLLLAVDGAAPLELAVAPTIGRFVQRFELPIGATELKAELRGPSGRLGPPLLMRLARAPEAVFALEAEVSDPEAELLLRLFAESGLFLRGEGAVGGSGNPAASGSKGSTGSKGLVRLELSDGIAAAIGSTAQPLRLSLDGMRALLGEERAEPLARWPLPSETVRPLAPRAGEIPLLLDAQGAPLALYASSGASRGNGAGTEAPAEPGVQPKPTATATATLRLSRDLLALRSGLVKDPAGLAALESLLRLIAGARAADTAWPAEAVRASSDLAAYRYDLALDPQATWRALGPLDRAVASTEAGAIRSWTSPDSRGVALTPPSLAGSSPPQTGASVARSSDSPLTPPLASERAPFRWFEVLIAFALGLALIEAFLFGRRRIP